MRDNVRRQLRKAQRVAAAYVAAKREIEILLDLKDKVLDILEAEGWTDDDEEEKREEGETEEQVDEEAGMMVDRVVGEGTEGPAAVTSPPARSPVTFSSLLPEVLERPLASKDMTWLVDTVAQATDRTPRRTTEKTAKSVRHAREEAGASSTWVGALPARQCAGTDVRHFCSAPDPSAGAWSGVRVPAGTDELRFWGPPDPLKRRWFRVRVSAGKGLPGTSVLAFRIPPDGGLWRLKKATTGRNGEAGTDVRSFRQPPDGGTRVDRALRAIGADG